MIVVPIILFLADTGTSPTRNSTVHEINVAPAATSIWATWSISEVKPGDNVLLANVTLRAKYFYSLTLALNVLCTRTFASLPPCE